MPRVLIVVILFLIPFSGYSQKWKLTRYEATLGIGPTNYFGDIGGSADKNNWFGIKDISLLGSRPSIYAAARYKIQENMAVKVNLDFIFLGGHDANSINSSRNYSFNTIGLEHSAQFEYSFFTEDRHKYSFALFNRRGMVNNFSKFNFYAYLGLGGLVYKPFFSPSTLPSKTSSYEFLNTSFQYTGIIPAGIGLKYIYNNYYSFNIEFGYRYVMTDYLDGFTTKYSKYNDIYYSTSFSVVYRIRTDRRGYPMLFRNNSW